MSKLGWLWQAGGWTLRTSTRPFRTGSWQKRLSLVLATTTGFGAVSATGYHYVHDHFVAPLASADGVNFERAPLPSTNRNPVVPLSVDEDTPAPLPTPPAEMFSSRRNPAARQATSRDRSPADRSPRDGETRSRFGDSNDASVRAVSDEQPTESGDVQPASVASGLPRSASRFSTTAAHEMDDERGSDSRGAESHATGDEPTDAAAESPPDHGAYASEDMTAEGGGLRDESPASGDESLTDDDPASTAAGSSAKSLPELPNTEQPGVDPSDDPPESSAKAGVTNGGRGEEPRNIDVPALPPLRSRSSEPSLPRPLNATPSLERGDTNRLPRTPSIPTERTPLGRIGADRQDSASLAGSNAASGNLAGGNLASATPGARHLDGPQLPSLAIEKLAPPEIQVGRSATFQIKVRNTSKVSAQDVVVTDQIPAGTEVIEIAPVTEPSADGQLRWNLGTLAPGADAVITIKLMPHSEGEIGSVAEVAFRAQASTRTTSTRPQVQLEINSPENVLMGESANMKITVTNKGTGAATDLFLDAVLPDGFTHPAGRELQSPLGNLAPGATKTIVLPLKATRAGEYDIAFSATNESNVQVTESIRIQVVAPQLEVAISGSKLRYLDRSANYQVTVSNPGTASADDVELVLFLSKGMKFVSANNSGQYDRASHAVYWHLEKLPAGSKGDVQVSLIPQEMGQQKLRVEGSTKSGIKQTDERSIQVEGIAELEFAINDTEDPVDVGNDTGYEILVTNRGSQAASNVQLTVDFPAELEPISGNGTTSARVGGNQVSFDPIGRLAPGEKAVFKVAARGVRAGDSRVRVQILSDELRNPITKEERTVVHADDQSR